MEAANSYINSWTITTASYPRKLSAWNVQQEWGGEGTVCRAMCSGRENCVSFVSTGNGNRRFGGGDASFVTRNRIRYCTCVTACTDCSGHAVYGVSLRPLTFWDCGFEFRRGMDVCCECCVLCCECCVLSGRGLSSRRFLPIVVCLSVIVKPRKWGALAHWGLTRHYKKYTEN